MSCSVFPQKGICHKNADILAHAQLDAYHCNSILQKLQSKQDLLINLAFIV